MKKNLSFLLLGVALFMASCSSGEKEIKRLSTEVMQIHDEVMPKTGTIYHLRKRLSEAAAQTEDSLQKEIFLRAEDSLKAADKLMMDWMHEYHPDPLLSLEEQKAYLEEEKRKIIRVRESIETNIANAEALLNKE